jgi:hypothetical protein
MLAATATREARGEHGRGDILALWWLPPSQRPEGGDGHGRLRARQRTNECAQVLPLRKGYLGDIVGHRPSTRREGIASLNLDGLVRNADTLQSLPDRSHCPPCTPDRAPSTTTQCMYVVRILLGWGGDRAAGWGGVGRGYGGRCETFFLDNCPVLGRANRFLDH